MWTEQDDLETEMGEDTECVGGSLRDSESSGYTNSSTSESKSCAGEDMLPEHLRTMYENAKKRLSTEQAEKLCMILVMFADVFAKNYLDLGKFTAIVHRIRTGESLHIRAGLRRTPLGFESVERATLDSMLGAGVIEPSQPEFAVAPVLVRKRDKSWRYCIDYRALNAATIWDVYPLPLIEECIDCLAGNLCTWYEFRLLADPSGWKGQTQDSIPNKIWVISIHKAAVWADKCARAVPEDG